jgi:hypothetical protein
MKKILVFAWLIAAAIGIVCGQGSPKQGIATNGSGSGAQATAEPQNEQHPASNVMVVLNQAGSPTDDPKKEQKAEDIRILWQIARFTRWLAIIGIVQAVVFFFTLFVIWRQGNHIIASERPWIIAEVVEVEPGFFKIRITNKGKTPARLLYGSAIYRPEPSPDCLPLPPNYTAPFIYPNQRLYTAERYFDIPCNPAPGYKLSDLLGKAEPMILYGNVFYGDTFDKKARHETRWCFGCPPKPDGVPKATDFMLTGPNEYTKND